MTSSVVDACPGSTRNAMESKAPCAVILISAVLLPRKGASLRWKASEGGSS